MPKFIDITSCIFNKLTVKHVVKKNNRTYWYCTCLCGGSITTRADHLKNGKTTSCGCNHRLAVTGNSFNKKHGYYKTDIYHVWQTMKARCNNPKNKSYKNYGGRGINVCQQWISSFSSFLSDMGDRPSSDLTIDRIDNNKGYYPDNCIWASRSAQAKNTRRNKHLIHNNVKG